MFEPFYVNQDVEKALKMTGLAFDELESIVGRFHDLHERAGQLRGKVVVTSKGFVRIVHHYNKRKLWESDEPLEEDYEDY